MCLAPRNPTLAFFEGKKNSLEAAITTTKPTAAAAAICKVTHRDLLAVPEHSRHFVAVVAGRLVLHHRPIQVPDGLVVPAQEDGYPPV